MTGSEPCKKRGVISMVAPSWAESAEIALTFAKDASGWLFNLGDSPHNNGYGMKLSHYYIPLPKKYVKLPFLPCIRF